MRELIITPEDLQEITLKEYEDLKGAIANAKSVKRRELEALPHNQRIEKDNIYKKAELAASNIVRRVPTHDEIMPHMARAAAEIQDHKEKDDWFYGVHVLENVPVFGTVNVMVRDDYQAPWQKVVSIEDGRQVMQRVEPAPRRMAAAAARGWTPPVSKAS